MEKCLGKVIWRTATFQPNGILLPKLFLPTVRKKIVLVIEKNFENFLRSQFIQTVKGQNNFWQQNTFLTYSWRFLISHKLEQLEFVLEKIIGI